MAEEKTYTKEEMELRERVSKLEILVAGLKEKNDSLEVAVKCHKHDKDQTRATFEYIH
jgi:hypothetical protein